MRLKDRCADALMFESCQNRLDHKGFFDPCMEDISPYMERNYDVGVVCPLIIISKLVLFLFDAPL